MIPILLRKERVCRIKSSNGVKAAGGKWSLSRDK